MNEFLHKRSMNVQFISVNIEHMNLCRIQTFNYSSFIEDIYHSMYFTFFVNSYRHNFPGERDYALLMFRDIFSM